MERGPSKKWRTQLTSYSDSGRMLDMIFDIHLRRATADTSALTEAYGFGISVRGRLGGVVVRENATKEGLWGAGICFCETNPPFLAAKGRGKCL